MIGAAPSKEEAESFEAKELAKNTVRVIEKGMENFTLGLRSYYFAIALMGWILHPIVGVFAASIVTLTLYRREFRSQDFGLHS